MIIIGRKDKIDMPEFGLFEIDAKVDTGAYGCALHCHKAQIVERDGKDCLSFIVLDPDHSDFEGKVFYTSNFTDKVVKNSGGEAEHRYVISTEIVIFDKPIKIDFSLTDRSSMKYPILLGRKFLSGRFLVNVKLKDISFQKKS